MSGRLEEEAAGWLAEAFETGSPLAFLPDTHRPADGAAGERIAAAVLDRLGMAGCGLRLGPGPAGTPEGERCAGPVLEGRLLSPASPLLLAGLRHARASAALLAVLSAPLEEGDTAPPVLAALHPAIDVAATRFRDPPAAPALLAADLGGLGQVVVGRRHPAPPLEALRAVPITFAPAAGRRPRPVPMDVAAVLEEAAREARRLGGLPAGAVLVLGGLSLPVVPEPGMTLVANLGPLGRVRASFA